MRNSLANSSNGSVMLDRALGPRIATAVVIGNVIGSGIFLKPGNIAAECGRFDIIISVWAVGGVLCILGALCFAELATMLPHAGGLYVYLREAYGRPVAFLFGWSEFLFGKPASIGALAVAFFGSLAKVLDWSFSPIAHVLLSTLLVLGLAFINIVGVLWGGRLQMLTTVIKAGFLVLVAIAPFLLLPFVPDGFQMANFATTAVPQQPTLAAQIGVVLLGVMWAYNGWHGITPLAEEVREPQRNIPLALFGGIGVLIVLYVAANIAYQGVLTMQEMKDAGDHAAEQMLDKLLGHAGLAMMSVVIMCSTFGAINTNLLQAPRVTFAMGRDGVFFRMLGQVHANFRTPAAAILITALMSIVLMIGVAVAKHAVGQPPREKAVSALSSANGQDDLNQRADAPRGLLPLVIRSLRNDSIFELLTNFVVFSASVFYMLGVLAVIVLRWRQPELPRPYRTWGYPLVPIAFLVVYTWFMAQIYRNQPLESRTGLLFIAAGIPVFYGYRWFSRRPEATRWETEIRT